MRDVYRRKRLQAIDQWSIRCTTLCLKRHDFFVNHTVKFLAGSNRNNNQMRVNEDNQTINRYLFWRHVSSVIQLFYSFLFEWPNREAFARRCL